MDILGIERSVDPEVLKRFNLNFYVYVIMVWNDLEKVFNDALRDGSNEWEDGLWIITNTTAWRYQAYFLRNVMLFGGAPEFFEFMKPRKKHAKFYTCMESAELELDLRSLGSEEDPSINP